MRARKVLLELLPEHVDVVVYDRARRIDARRLPIKMPPDVAEWAVALRREVSTLRAAVEQMHAAGSNATVLYESPTAAVDLSGVAVRGEAQAVESARMSCVDSLPYSALTAVCEAAIVGRDDGDESSRTHVVSAADREDVATAIVQFVEGAGLKLASLTPRNAAVMAGLVQAALNDKGKGKCWLSFGLHSSFFVIAREGRVLFSRRIDLGLESLANSLTRPIRMGGGKSAELDLDAARWVLKEHGIPPRDAVVHEPLELKGFQVMPLMQPVLQRFVIELRQSLRFGLAEEDRKDLSIQVLGPGAAVKVLAELLSTELDVPSTADETDCQTDFSQPGAQADQLVRTLWDGGFGPRLNLLPQDVAAKRRLNRVRHWLWMGTAAALIMVAADGVRSHLHVREARRQAAAQTTQINQNEGLSATGAKLGEALKAIEDLDRAIDEQAGWRVDFRACMQELSRVTPPAIRLASIDFKRRDGDMAVTVSGYAFQDGSDAQNTDLESLIEELRSSPLFDDVVLGNVRMQSIHDVPGHRFEATFVAVSVPRQDAVGKHLASGEGGASG